MPKAVKIFEALSIEDSLGQITGKAKERVANMVRDARGSDSPIGLLSEIAVTHGGIVNGNFGYYKPERLNKSVRTWVEPFNKPLLKNHDYHTEPLGRTVASVWRSTVPSVIPDVRNSIQRADYSFRGLGHIQNLVSVSDPDAVAKVLDGRYLTVSVSGETDEMTCSICGQNWLEDGRCEHRFGKEYEDEDSGKKDLAYWVGGDFVWDEVSFVNTPADPFAQVVTREVSADAQDQIIHTYDYKDVTILKAQVADSKNRLIKLYAINDSLGKGIKLDDETSLDELDRLYGKRIFQVLTDLKKKETKVEKPELTPVKIEDQKTASVPTPDPAPAPAAPVPEPPKDEKKPEPPVAPIPEPPKDEKLKNEPIPAAPIPTPPVEDTKIKALEEENKNLKDELQTEKSEKDAASKLLTDLQSQIRKMKITQILDLKQRLNLVKFTTEDECKAAEDELQTRAIESIDDQIKDLSASLKEASKVKPSTIKIGDSDPVADTELEKALKVIDETPVADLLKRYLNGKWNPRS
jgi:hypothetical protein